MFQRRMLLVASRLQNANLTAPKLFSLRKDNEEPIPPPQQQDGSTTTIGHSGGITERINNVSATLDFDTIALNLKNKSIQKSQSCMDKLRRNFIYVAFVLYLLVGTLFYMYDPGNEVHGILAYYQAITIGFSVGLGTKDPAFIPNVWFSSLYILVGASIIAVMLTVAGNEVEEAASMSMFDALQRRENYESQMARDNPLMVRIRAFLAYNAAYLICILLWILWMGFIMAWAMIQVPEWDFGHAQYFAVSLCSSAGSFSLPTSSSNTAYGLAGLSMMVGVPLMAMGVSSVIIMLWQGHRFQTVKLAAWEDVTQEELKLLNELGVVDIGEGEELTKGGFILLGLLRMGQDVGVIKYLADAHETIQDRGGVIIRETSDPNNEGTGYYSKQAQALIGDSKDEVDEMLEFTSHTSSAASTLTPLFKASTAATVESKRNANDRSWSTTAGFDSGSSRNFSGLSQVFGGGGGGNENDHYLATIDESLTTSAQRRVEENDDNGTIPSRLDSDIATILTISRLDSDIGISIKSKDSWDSNNP